MQSNFIRKTLHYIDNHTGIISHYLKSICVWLDSQKDINNTIDIIMQQYTRLKMELHQLAVSF